MKDYKWGKGLGNIALCGLGGAIVGVGTQLIPRIITPAALKITFYQLTPYLFLLALACGIIGITGYFYFNTRLKKDGYSNDEDSLFEHYENKINLIMVFSTLCVIVNFTAFGLNFSYDIKPMYFLLFLVNGALGFMGEVSNISLIKKVRPELSADPVNSGFHKNYFEQLDECEKIKTGKASFKTITSMLFVYLTVFLICLFLIVTLDVSPIICLPIGLLWLIQTVLGLYYSCKEN